LCDLFVADPSDARHYDEHFDEHFDEQWADRFESAPLRGITQLEFELLWAIVEGRPWDPEELAPAVESLLALARSAEASRRGLFLWGSL
jgi:hypothetical protein